MNEKIVNYIKNNQLTKNDKRIAEYFLENERELFFFNAKEIAKRLGISDTSVIRFVKKLGFKSFSEYKNALDNEMKKKVLTPSEKLSVNLEILNNKELESIFKKNIESQLNMIMSNEIVSKAKEIVKTILNSDKKYIIGFKSTSGYASFLGLRIGFLLENVKSYPSNSSELMKDLMDLNSRDCIVLLAFPKYSKIYELIVEKASEVGAKIIVITDKKTSKLIDSSTISIVLNIKGLSYFNSLIPLQILIEYLLTYLSSNATPRMKERLEAVDMLLNKNL